MLPVQHILKTIGLLIFMDSVLGLELLELRVPRHVPLGTRAHLACRWQLAPRDVLYSVKWYKNGNEFFRHVPRATEPRRQFPLPGVQVEKADALGSTLTLGPAVPETSGRYRCEVSGERPLFPTVSEHADLLVVALPSTGPTITGLRSHYAPGEHVHVACTSGRSLPAATLAWFVNGAPAPPAAVSRQRETRHEDGLITSSLEMDFEEEYKESGLLKVKCLATLGPAYLQSIEESAERRWAPAYRGRGFDDGPPKMANFTELDKLADSGYPRYHGSARAWCGNSFVILSTSIVIAFCLA